MSNQCTFQDWSKQFAFVVEQLQSGGHRIELRALPLPQCQDPAEEAGPPDAVRQGKRGLLVHGYRSKGFHALPTARVQREWLARWSS